MSSVGSPVGVRLWGFCIACRISVVSSSGPFVCVLFRMVLIVSFQVCCSVVQWAKWWFVSGSFWQYGQRLCGVSFCWLLWLFVGSQLWMYCCITFLLFPFIRDIAWLRTCQSTDSVVLSFHWCFFCRYSRYCWDAAAVRRCSAVLLVMLWLSILSDALIVGMSYSCCSCVISCCRIVVLFRVVWMVGGLLGVICMRWIVFVVLCSSFAMLLYSSSSSFIAVAAVWNLLLWLLHFRIVLAQGIHMDVGVFLDVAFRMRSSCCIVVRQLCIASSTVLFCAE